MKTTNENPDAFQSRTFSGVLFCIAIIACWVSESARAQIQFAQVPAPLPAPQIIADFSGVSNGAVAFADVDGDGDMDALITGEKKISPDPEDDQIEIISELYLNDGFGNFSGVAGTPFEPVAYSTVAFADVDGDGDQDVLITGAIGIPFVSILYINDGNGNFSLSQGTPFDGVTLGSTAFADVDGDGDMDVLITGRNNANQRIAKLYSNDGSGNFALVNGTPFTAVDQGSVAFADVDGDGDQDVIITGQSAPNQRIAHLYLNVGNGNFSLGAGTPFEGVSLGSVAFADVDGDGDADVLITGRTTAGLNTARLYTNDGNGSYSLVIGTPFPGVSEGAAAFGDVDGDGDQDVLISGSGAGPSRIYTNDGNGLCRITKAGYPAPVS